MTVTIPVFSDSHGRGHRVSEVIERLNNCGEGGVRVALFLGDGMHDLAPAIPEGCSLLAVAGNCDIYDHLYDSEGNVIPDDRVEFIGGLRIFMTHGHKYSVKGGYGAAIARARRLNADILLFGHTHLPFTDYLPPDGAFNKPLCVMNPGSLRDGSFGVITISDGTPLLSLGRL